MDRREFPVDRVRQFTLKDLLRPELEPLLRRPSPLPESTSLVHTASVSVEPLTESLIVYSPLRDSGTFKGRRPSKTGV